MSSVFCAIIIVTVGYIILLAGGFIAAIREAKEEALLYKRIAEHLLSELVLIANEEEARLKQNTLTLTDLITRKATEEQYTEVADLLIELFRKAYDEDSYFLAKSPDEHDQANFLQIVSHSSEQPELHKKIFNRGMHYGIEMPTLLKVFAKKVEQGELIGLGEDAVVILDDNTGNPPTGVSPINSGVQGGEISCIISFIKLSNYAGWHENHFPKEDEEVKEDE